MKLSTFTYAALSLSATLTWFGVQSAGAADESMQAADLAKGKALYDARCGTVCHAKGGIGTFNLEKRLGAENSVLAERTNLSPELIEYVARHGINSMPYLTRGELPDAELKLISAYLTRPAELRK